MHLQRLAVVGSIRYVPSNFSSELQLIGRPSPRQRHRNVGLCLLTNWDLQLIFFYIQISYLNLKTFTPNKDIMAYHIQIRLLATSH